MTYQPIKWKDRIVEKPNTFETKYNDDNTLTLIPDPGQVLQEGTPLTAENLNHIEKGLIGAYAQLEHCAKKDDVAKISSGTPLFTSSTTEMTDVTKNYVNTTDGYLYIYSNGNWTKTGVKYQEMGLSDGQVTPEKLVSINENLQIGSVESGYRLVNGVIEAVS